MEYQWRERSGKKSFHLGFQIKILTSEEFREEYPDIFTGILSQGIIT